MGVKKPEGFAGFSVLGSDAYLLEVMESPEYYQPELEVGNKEIHREKEVNI